MKFFKQFKDKDSKPLEITESEVRKELIGYYKDIDLAIESLLDMATLETYFALYWAK